MTDTVVFPCNIETPNPRIALGDKFTIAGVKVVGPAKFITNCAPGDESVFEYSTRPSVFKISDTQATVSAH